MLERELDEARAADLIKRIRPPLPSQLFRVCVEKPNCGEVMQLIGARKLGWLKMLKKSALVFREKRSVSLNVLCKVKSTWQCADRYLHYQRDRLECFLYGSKQAARCSDPGCSIESCG